MRLKEERRINENESVWEEAKGKRGEGCVMGTDGMDTVITNYYQLLLFKGVA